MRSSWTMRSDWRTYLIRSVFSRVFSLCHPAVYTLLLYYRMWFKLMVCTQTLGSTPCSRRMGPMQMGTCPHLRLDYCLEMRIKQTGPNSGHLSRKFIHPLMLCKKLSWLIKIRGWSPQWRRFSKEQHNSCGHFIIVKIFYWHVVVERVRFLILHYGRSTYLPCAIQWRNLNKRKQSIMISYIRLTFTIYV